MPQLAFDQLYCVRTSLGGVTPDHVSLTFKADDTTTYWPAQDEFISIDNQDSLTVNRVISFEQSLTVTLTNYHNSHLSQPRILGTATFTANNMPTGPHTWEFTSEQYKSDYTLQYKPVTPSATVRLLGLDCIKTATATDQSVLSGVSALASALTQAVGEGLSGIQDPRAQAAAIAAKAASQIFAQVPGLAQAIADANNYPDQLFISLGDQSDKNQKIYPKGDYQEVNTGEIINLEYANLQYDIIDELAFTIWEYDSGSSDDSLGTFYVNADNTGIQVSIVESPTEGSIYLATYDVQPST